LQYNSLLPVENIIEEALILKLYSLRIHVQKFVE